MAEQAMNNDQVFPLYKMDLNFVPEMWQWNREKHMWMPRQGWDLRRLAEAYVEIFINKPVDSWTEIIKCTKETRAEILGSSVSFPPLFFFCVCNYY